jgi:hypothetical protein
MSGLWKDPGKLNIGGYELILKKQLHSINLCADYRRVDQEKQPQEKMLYLCRVI